MNSEPAAAKSHRGRSAESVEIERNVMSTDAAGRSGGGKNWICPEVADALRTLVPNLPSMSEQEADGKVAELIVRQARFLDAMMKKDRRGRALGTLHAIRGTEMGSDAYIVYRKELAKKFKTVRQLDLADLHGLIFTAMNNDYKDLLRKLRSDRIVSEGNKARHRSSQASKGGGLEDPIGGAPNDGHETRQASQAVDRDHEALKEFVESGRGPVERSGDDSPDLERLTSQLDELFDLLRHEQPHLAEVFADRFRREEQDSREAGAARLKISVKVYRQREDDALKWMKAKYDELFGR